MSDARLLELLVSGKRYAGWKSASITRTIDALSGSFSLSVTDAWANQLAPWPIREGDQCSLIVGGTPLVTGYVDKRSVSLSATSHSITIEGRDAAAALADCSADLGGWQFKAQPFLPFVVQLGAQFGVPVYPAPGVSLPVIPADMSITPGDSAFSVLDRLCKFAGVLPVSDGAGGIVLTRPGLAVSPVALVEGVNILSGSADFDQGSRFRRYVVLGQGRGGGTESTIRGEAVDLEVSRADRVLIMQAESATNRAAAEKRAQYERATRAARAETVRITVAGLYAVPGWHWRPGELVQVRAPRLGVDGTMVIQEVSQEVSSATKTELTLIRPDAYALDPEEVGTWKR